jgi:hypothetical protein
VGNNVKIYKFWKFTWNHKYKIFYMRKMTKKYLKSKFSLELHIYSHDWLKPYKCEECGKGYWSMYAQHWQIDWNLTVVNFPSLVRDDFKTKTKTVKSENCPDCNKWLIIMRWYMVMKNNGIIVTWLSNTNLQDYVHVGRDA